MNSPKFIRYNPILTKEAKQKRLNQTPAEKFMWDKLLRKRKTGFKFRRQKPILNFILDFYCSKLLLGIEIVSAYHNNQENYDQDREFYLKILALKLFDLKTMMF